MEPAVRSGPAAAVGKPPGQPRPAVAPAASVPAPSPRQAGPTAARAEGGLRPSYAQFVVDPSTDRVLVRIVDATTGVVIREIPPEEMRRVAESLREYAQVLARQRGARTSPLGPTS